MDFILKNKKEITIIDYNAGNLKSIVNILDYLGYRSFITSNPTDILNSEKLIFPGQGHFAQAMNNLTARNLIDPIKQVIQDNRHFLGICLGLQILFEKSEEAPNIKGLGILKGDVKKFQKGKTPQIGWNKIVSTQKDQLLQDNYFYFVNSYYVSPLEIEIISSETSKENEHFNFLQILL